MNAYDIVTRFESRVAEYCGAPYGVAVESCTSALFLCLWKHRLIWGPDTITLPCKTYVGVAQAVLLSGHKIQFVDYPWNGLYRLDPVKLWDAARWFTKGIYDKPGHEICLSFHYQKHLPLGRGGMILTDNKDDAELYRRMRFDGRRAGVPPKDDDFCQGFHCHMEADVAARGDLLMNYVKDKYDPLPMDDYADLSKFEVFRE